MPVAWGHPRAHARRVDPEPARAGYTIRPDLNGSVDDLEGALDEAPSHLAHLEADARALGRDTPGSLRSRRRHASTGRRLVACSGRHAHVRLDPRPPGRVHIAQPTAEPRSVYAG